jgi:hypothetical protein
MNGWRIDTVLLGPEARQLFFDLDTVFALEGEPITRDPLSEVLRVNADGQRYYVKRYQGAGKNLLRRWIGRPRVQAEWENLLAFRAWGIATATVVGRGLERHSAAFARGALITEEIPAAIDLARLAADADPRLHDRPWVTHVSRQVAAITRTLHAHRFAHNDLKWRNLLVDNASMPTVYLIDCPSGAYWRPPFLAYRMVKDLACLDKVARHQLSRTQRLRFYLDYVQQSRLHPADRVRIRRILAFFTGRE